MGNSVGKSVLKSMMDRNSILGIIGLTCALMAMNARRLSIEDNFYSLGFGDTTTSITVVVLAILAFVYFRTPQFRLTKRTSVVICIGVGAFISTYLIHGPLPIPLDFPAPAALITNILDKVFCSLFLLMWVEQHRFYSTRRLTLLLGLTFALLSLCVCLVILFQPVFSQFFVAMAPLISTAILVLYLKGDKKVPQLRLENPTISKRHFLAIVLILCACVFIYTFACGSVHAAVGFTNGAASSVTEFRITDIFGLFLAGCVLAFISLSSRWKSALRDAVLLLPSVFALAYSLTLACPPELLFTVNIPLSIARHMVALFWIIVLVYTGEKALGVSALLLIGYRIAQNVGFVPFAVSGYDYYSNASSLLVIFFLVLLISVSFLFDLSCLAPLSITKAGAATDDYVDSPHAVDTDGKAIDAISQRYGLSKREIDVLILLVEGWHAQSVAEKLFISPATAKNHMRNIYSKLDVHSQNEILTMYERERNAQSQNNS